MTLPRWNRRDYYDKVVVNGVNELDYLSYKWIGFAQMIRNTQCQAHSVNEIELGRMWSISQRYYNTDTLDMMLCMINGILDPMRDMYIGQRLAIPPISSFENYYLS